MDYRNLLPLPPVVREAKSAYSGFAERQLQILWAEQKYLCSMRTVEGEPIEVISYGMWNTGSGPDFLNAHLKIGQKEWRGDIEIHLESNGWYNHGHHLDPRYNNVVLHLYFWDSVKTKKIIAEDGREIPSLSLAHFLTMPFDFILPLLNTDIFPHRQSASPGNCSEFLFKKLSTEEIREFFQSASLWRMEKKVEYLNLRSRDRSLRLLAGIAMGLGYTKNTEPFLDLCLYLVHFRHFPENVLLAIGLGCCGYFDVRQRLEWRDNPYYKELELHWLEHRSEVDLQVHLRLDKIRPYNHPIRRLAFLIKLICDPESEKMESRLIQLWETKAESINGEKAAKKLLRQMFRLFPIYDDDYWLYHFSFEWAGFSLPIRFIGDDLKTEMILNTFMPIILEKIRDEGQSKEKFKLFYAFITTQITKKGKYLQNRFFGSDPRGALMRQSQILQGAYQLHQDFCVHYETSCVGCPFVERFHTLRELSN